MLAVDDGEAFAGEIVRVARDFWKELGFGNRIRNVPVGAENYILHGVAEDGRVVVISFSYHHAHHQGEMEVLVISAEAEFGDIGDDGRAVVADGEPAPAFEG